MLRPKVGRLWANNSSVVRRDPGDAKYLIGWLSEIPTYQVLNYLQWKTDCTFLALAERGVLEWGSDVTYKKGAACWDETNGKIYISLLDGPNKTLAPSANSGQWTGSAIQLSRVAYDATVAKIDAHIADVTGNPHKLTPGRLGTYTVAQIDVLVAQYRAEVQTHASNKNNPHKVTASQIGAVPIEGGNYTGNVTMDTGQILLSSDGTRAIKADGTGVYMKNDAGQVGVDATGKGFVKIGSAAASEIITRATFADNKQTVEPFYSVPAPIFVMPLLRDINIYVGGGTSNTSFNPQYDSSGKLTLPAQSGTVHSMSLDSVPGVGATSMTVAADISVTAASGSAEPFSLGIGLPAGGRCRIGIKTNGSFEGSGSGGKAATSAYTDGATRRIVVRVTPTATSIFVNGQLVTTTAGNNTAIETSPLALLTSDTASLVAGVCNFRVWDSALSDSQISNL